MRLFAFFDKGNNAFKSNFGIKQCIKYSEALYEYVKEWKVTAVCLYLIACIKIILLQYQIDAMLFSFNLGCENTLCHIAQNIGGLPKFYLPTYNLVAIAKLI